MATLKKGLWHSFLIQDVRVVNVAMFKNYDFLPNYCKDIVIKIITTEQWISEYPCVRLEY